MMPLNHGRLISHDRLLNQHHYGQRVPTLCHLMPVNDQSVERLLS